MRAYLSLGSNVGDRAANLHEALSRLEALSGCRLLSVSQTYETEPVGIAEQPPFLNLAAEIETVLTPLELLTAAKEMEAEMGRVSRARWKPRPIDIDIVLWEDWVLESERLVVPHPEFRKRAFVLRPLAEIAGEAVDPVTGYSVHELAEACLDASWIRVYETAGA